MLNLAQGDLMMLGGDALFAAVTTVAAPPAAAIPLALAASATVGFLIYVLLMARMAGHPGFAAVLVNLLTGMAGQISLGHAGFLAAGPFTVGMLVEGIGAPPWLTLPAAAAVGAVLGLIVGIPSLRLKGLYLALGTLAMHYVVLRADAARGGGSALGAGPRDATGLAGRRTRRRHAPACAAARRVIGSTRQVGVYAYGAPVDNE